MALILYAERKIRTKQITELDKQFTIRQILKPASLRVLEYVRAN